MPRLKIFHILVAVMNALQGVQEKLFFHNSLQSLPRLHRCKRPSYAMRVYSHFYWLVIFYITNSSRVLVRERWQTFENSWKKTFPLYGLVCPSGNPRIKTWIERGHLDIALEMLEIYISDIRYNHFQI